MPLGLGNRTRNRSLADNPDGFSAYTPAAAQAVQDKSHTDAIVQAGSLPFAWASGAPGASVTDDSGQPLPATGALQRIDPATGMPMNPDPLGLDASTHDNTPAGVPDVNMGNIGYGAHNPATDTRSFQDRIASLKSRALPGETSSGLPGGSIFDGDAATSARAAGAGTVDGTGYLKLAGDSNATAFAEDPPQSPTDAAGMLPNPADPEEMYAYNNANRQSQARVQKAEEGVTAARDDLGHLGRLKEELTGQISAARTRRSSIDARIKELSKLTDAPVRGINTAERKERYGSRLLAQKEREKLDYEASQLDGQMEVLRGNLNGLDRNALPILNDRLKQATQQHTLESTLAPRESQAAFGAAREDLKRGREDREFRRAYQEDLMANRVAGAVRADERQDQTQANADRNFEQRQHRAEAGTASTGKTLAEDKSRLKAVDDEIKRIERDPRMDVAFNKKTGELMQEKMPEDLRNQWLNQKGKRDKLYARISEIPDIGSGEGGNPEMADLTRQIKEKALAAGLTEEEFLASMREAGGED